MWISRGPTSKDTSTGLGGLVSAGDAQVGHVRGYLRVAGAPIVAGGLPDDHAVHRASGRVHGIPGQSDRMHDATT